MKSLLLLLLLAIPASARIGETREQCITRYGRPTGDKDGMVVFHKAGLMVAVKFYDGKAAVILFKKEEGIMSAEEFSTLLSANAAGRTTRDMSADNWRLIQEGDIVLFDRTDPTRVMIGSVVSMKRLEAEGAAKKQENLKDF